MAGQESTILEVTAKGYVMNPELYGAMYKSFIDKNRDEEGNILDDTEEQKLCEALRSQLIEMNKQDLAQCLEQLVTYGNFGGSDGFMKYIDIAKRFVVAVEKEHEKVHDFYPYYERALRDNKGLTSIDAWSKALISNTIENYILSIC